MDERSIGMDKTLRPGGEARSERNEDRAAYALAEGSTLGQYRIVRPLGRGGMGEVYEVEHKVLRRRYALKLLPADFAAQAGALARFEREAQVMANLEHPNILRVDDFGETAGRYWLRMELAGGQESPSFAKASEGKEGQGAGRGKPDEVRGPKSEVISLQDLADARGGRIPQEELVGILSQILDGLAYAHGHGAIHRDLKPSNILLFSGRDGAPRRPGSSGPNAAGYNGSVVGPGGDRADLDCQIKIADFGLVRLVGEEWVRSQAQLSVQGSMSMGDLKTLQMDADKGTSTRSMLGTYEYMSPEQKRGEEATAQSDLYAVGLMGYRLLTGRGLSMKTPSQIDKTLALEWDEFLAKALEEDAAERWADPKAMKKALAVFGHHLEMKSGEPPVPSAHVFEETAEQRDAEPQGLWDEKAQPVCAEVGKIYRATVTGIKDFGCFAEFIPGTEGLVHVSELADGRVDHVEDIVKVGDEIWVKVLSVTDYGAVRLSRKAAIQEQSQQMPDSPQQREDERIRQTAKYQPATTPPASETQGSRGFWGWFWIWLVVLLVAFLLLVGLSNAGAAPEMRGGERYQISS